MDKEEQLNKSEEVAGMEAAFAEEMEKRKKALWRHKVPEGRSLEDALNTMTKAELDDIRYNLCVHGVSSLKKQELAKALAKAVVEFSQRWLLTIGIEQYNIITHLSRKNGISTVLDMEDARMDYMRSLGLVFSGMQDKEQAWYLPNELLKVYHSMANDSYRKEISFNDEITHLATGLLYYYGYMSVEKLHAMVNEQLKERDIDFVDFMGIMINAGCWNGNIINDGTGMYYYSVLDVNKLIADQDKQTALDYCQFSYDELYAAGEKDFVIVTDEYKELVKLLHEDVKLSEKTAAEVAAEVLLILQNNESVNEVFAFFQHYFVIPNKDTAESLASCVERLRLVTPVWEYKGHSPAAMANGAKKEFHMQTTKNNVVKFVPRSSKIGRNEPCPCGSGKKYKKCCMDKEY